MDQKQKKLIFIAINIVLVLTIGLILGFTLPVTENNAMLLSFILLLVTLCTPTLLFLTVKDIGSPIGISSLLFIVANLITLIVFMFTIKDIKVVAITEGGIVGAFLIVMLICVAALPNKKAE